MWVTKYDFVKYIDFNTFLYYELTYFLKSNFGKS